MIKYYLPIILSVVSFYGLAQYRPTTYDAPPRMNIYQIDNREYSTLIFLDYTTPEDSICNQSQQSINFSDKTYLTFPGSDKKYKMLSTVNMPIDSEAEHKKMLFDRSGQRHQFVLEFEKLPDNCSNFDIIEDISNPYAFNIRNVVLNCTDSFPFVDIDAYIKDYPLKEYGQYYVNGKVALYVKFNDITVNSVANFLDQYGKYIRIDLNVQNFRNNSILFNPDNLSAIGYGHPKKQSEKDKINLANGNREIPKYAEHSVRRNKKEAPLEVDETITIPCDVEVLSYKEYDRIVRKKQNWESFWVELGEGLAAAGAGYSYSTNDFSSISNTTGKAFASANVGGIYGYARAYNSSYTTTYGKLYTTSYNGLAQYAANQQARENIENFKNSQNIIRKRIRDGYVKKHTIPTATEYTGFFNVRYNRKITELSYTIVIDGEPYTFNFELSLFDNSPSDS